MRHKYMVVIGELSSTSMCLTQSQFLGLSFIREKYQQ